jgi:hypothetical protein
MRRRVLLALLVAVAALGATASAAMDGETPTVTVGLADPAVAYGVDVVTRGRVSAGGADQVVVVEQRRGSSWTRVAGVRTTEGGTFVASFAPVRSGPIRARLAESGALSAAAPLRVRPLLRISVGKGRAFLGARMVVRVQPTTYDGEVTARVRKRGRRVAVTHGRVVGGLLRLRLPTPGVGRFRVRVVLSETEEFAAVRAPGSVRSSARDVAYGSSGKEVGALHRRLAELRYRVPDETDVYGAELLDAVLAFQKTNGLSRDGYVGEDVWRALGRARTPKPRHAKPAYHIEVDKTRQILLVVRNGKVRTVIPVSTGATGNTPEGTFRIRWKALATRTWLGPALLYRTMTFLGNEFAIHGFPSVPAYPASHGCVRIPIWVADWLYQRSPVGTRIFIYR